MKRAKHWLATAFEIAFMMWMIIFVCGWIIVNTCGVIASLFGG